MDGGDPEEGGDEGEGEEDGEEKDSREGPGNILVGEIQMGFPNTDFWRFEAGWSLSGTSWDSWTLLI